MLEHTDPCTDRIRSDEPASGRSRGRMRAAVGLLLFACVATPAHAQDFWPVSFEIAAGPDYGFAPDGFRDDSSSLGSGIISIGFHPAAPGAGGLVAAVEFGTQFAGARTDDCIFGPDGGCLPWPPTFSTLAGLGGWESRAGRVKVMGGVGAARPQDDWESVRLALVARTGAYFGPRDHLSLLVFARAMVVPSYGGGAHGSASFGVGLRVR